MGKCSKFKMMWLATACATLGLGGCDDEDGLSPYDAAVVSDGGDAAGGSKPPADASDDTFGDAVADGSVGDALGDGGGDAAAPTAQQLRGSYLVNTVLVCSDCHTPRLPTGAPDLSKYLAGNQCFIDVDPSPTAGCLATRNLTNHTTGLANRTDQQIKDMFTKGIRPDGKALHSVMPYYQFALLNDADADAIVAYLRTVKGVENMIGPNQAPFDMQPPAAATLVTAAEIPAVPTELAEKASAERGRYLASVACLECHTPELPMGSARPIDVTKAFSGNRAFPRALLGLPPVFPDVIYSSNITPHGTGINSYSPADIVKALKQGIDKSNKKLCPPMPAGMAAFANLTEQDALDIAHYLLALTPVNNPVSGQCEAP